MPLQATHIFGLGRWAATMLLLGSSGLAADEPEPLLVPRVEHVAHIAGAEISAAFVDEGELWLAGWERDLQPAAEAQPGGPLPEFPDEDREAARVVHRSVLWHISGQGQVRNAFVLNEGDRLNRLIPSVLTRDDAGRVRVLSTRGDSGRRVHQHTVDPETGALQARWLTDDLPSGPVLAIDGPRWLLAYVDEEAGEIVVQQREDNEVGWEQRIAVEEPVQLRKLMPQPDRVGLTFDVGDADKFGRGIHRTELVVLDGAGQPRGRHARGGRLGTLVPWVEGAWTWVWDAGEFLEEKGMAAFVFDGQAFDLPLPIRERRVGLGAYALAAGDEVTFVAAGTTHAAGAWIAGFENGTERWSLTVGSQGEDSARIVVLIRPLGQSRWALIMTERGAKGGAIVLFIGVDQLPVDQGRQVH